MPAVVAHSTTFSMINAHAAAAAEPETTTEEGERQREKNSQKKELLFDYYYVWCVLKLGPDTISIRACQVSYPFRFCLVLSRLVSSRRLPKLFILVICFNGLPSQFSAHINFKSAFVPIHLRHRNSSRSVCACGECIERTEETEAFYASSKRLLSFHRKRYVYRLSLYNVFT